MIGWQTIPRRHWALKKWTFNHKFTNGLWSNFSLQKWKMKKNKHHYTIQLELVTCFDYNHLDQFSFEIAWRTTTFSWKLTIYLSPKLNLFRSSVGRLQILTKIFFARWLQMMIQSPKTTCGPKYSVSTLKFWITRRRVTNWIDIVRSRTNANNMWKSENIFVICWLWNTDWPMLLSQTKNFGWTEETGVHFQKRRAFSQMATAFAK